MRVRRLRVEREGRTVVLVCVVVAAELVERRTEIDVHIRERRIDRERRLVVLDRFVDGALRLQCDGEVVVGVGERGFEFQRGPVAAQRDIVLPGGRGDEAAIAPAMRVRRIGVERAVEQRRCAQVVAALMVQHAVVMQCRRMVGR